MKGQEMHHHNNKKRKLNVALDETTLNAKNWFAVGGLVLAGILLSIANRYGSDQGVTALVYATFLGEVALAFLAAYLFRGMELLILVLGAALLIPGFKVQAGLPMVRLEQLLVFFYVLNQLRQKRGLGLTYKPIRFWFGAFAVAIGLSIIYAWAFLGSSPSVRDWYEIIKLISYYFFFYLAFNELPGTKSYGTLLKVFIGIMTAGNLFAVAQYYNVLDINSWLTVFYASPTQYEAVIGYAHRVVGLFSNSNDYGMLNILFITLLLAKFYTQKLSTGWTVLYLLLFALSYRATYMTLSRSAIITGTLTFIAVLIWVHRRKQGQQLWRKAGVVLLLAVALYVTMPDTATDRLGRLLAPETDNSIQTRVNGYGDATELFLASPIFGWGPAKETMPSVVDNDFMLLLRRYGLLGLSMYLLLYWKLFSHAVTLRTDDRNVKVGSVFMVAGMIGLMAFNIPAGTVKNMQFLDWYWLMAGAYFAAEQAGMRAERQPKKKVLMLLSNPYTHDPRVRIEAQTLKKHGHKVTILCWDRLGGQPQSEKLDGIEVIRIHKPSRPGSSLRQLPAMLKFGIAAWHYATRRIQYDVVHAHDFDTVTLGYFLANDRHVPLIYDAHESYADMVGERLPGWMRRGLICAENFYLKRARTVITVGNILKEELTKRGAKKALLIGNWKELTEFAIPEQQLAQKRQELDLGNKLVVSYLGGLSPVRNVLPLVEAVSKRPGVALLIAGTGGDQEAVAQAAATYENIHYLGQIPAQEIAFYTALSDVVYYGVDPAYPNAKYSAPNKLYEAMAGGKALLVTAAGEVGPTVAKEQAGIVLSLDGVLSEQIGEALDQLSDRNLLQEFQHNSREAGIKKYNWTAGSESLRDLYKQL